MVHFCSVGGVALFFILSGAVLIARYRDDFNFKEFYAKRFIRICVPQWIGFIGAFLLCFVVNKNIINFDWRGMVISFLGLNYTSLSWAELGIRVMWIIGEWFTAVIIIVYLLFPFLRFLFIKHRISGSIFILFMGLLNLKFQILSYANGWFSFSNGIMYFWLGMLFDEYKGLFYSKKLLLCLLMFLNGFIIYNPEDIIGIKYIPCFISSLLVFPLLYQIRFSTRFTQYICKYNYELYLIHHRIYIILIPALLKAKSNDLQIILAFVFLTLIVFYFSELLAKATGLILQNVKFHKG
ncbi:MAG: acyltransferase family protein [Acetobacter sp.]|nr:acyltransferase family protein [Acetobacter sp.]